MEKPPFLALSRRTSRHFVCNRCSCHWSYSKCPLDRPDANLSVHALATSCAPFLFRTSGRSRRAGVLAHTLAREWCNGQLKAIVATRTWPRRLEPRRRMGQGNRIARPQTGCNSPANLRFVSPSGCSLCLPGNVVNVLEPGGASTNLGVDEFVIPFPAGRVADSHDCGRPQSDRLACRSGLTRADLRFAMER